MKEIPPGVFRYRPWAEFTRGLVAQSDRWYVFGPASLVVPGQVVEVQRFQDGPTEIHVLKVIAERVARTRANGEVRYVIAEFDNVVEQPELGEPN